MTPFSQFKGMTAEGGIRNALIVSGPAVKRPKGSINGGFMHVADIMPTLLEAAGTAYPKTLKGHDLPPLAGKSWMPVLAGRAESPRTDQDYMGWEIFGNRALRQGDWKLRWQWKPYGTGDWELYNLASDPVERTNLAAQNPDKLKALLALWDEYAKANNVIIPSRSIFENAEDQLPTRFPVDSGYPPAIYKKQFVPPPNLIKR
jgi:arylsulfatase